MTGSTTVMVIPQLSHRCTMRSLVSMARIATEQIGQALGGVKAWGCRSMRPITVPNNLCRIDLDQKGPLIILVGIALAGSSLLKRHK